jgi:two-component system LytT family response regulator
MSAPITTIRTMIVDDEVLARENVIALLRDDPEIQIVAQSSNGTQAVAAVIQHQPELLFLDVQMPGMTGLEVLGKLPTAALPQVVFVTAYDHFALEAFEIQAVDYLLKPFSRARFATALARAKASVRLRDREAFARRLDDIMASLGRLKAGAEPTPPLAVRSSPEEEERLFIRCDGEIIAISPDEIFWVESDGDYVRLHLADKARFVRMPLLKMMAKLPSARFVQIHRSTVMNLRHMRKASTAPFGEYSVELTNGVKLKVTRTFVHSLKAHL